MLESDSYDCRKPIVCGCAVFLNITVWVQAQYRLLSGSQLLDPLCWCIYAQNPEKKNSETKMIRLATQNKIKYPDKIYTKKFNSKNDPYYGFDF